MGTVTGWVLRTWIKWTLFFAAAVGAVWLFTGAGGWFWTSTALAVIAEYYLIRQLSREWRYEARLTWWWSA